MKGVLVLLFPAFQSSGSVAMAGCCVLSETKKEKGNALKETRDLVISTQ